MGWSARPLAPEVPRALGGTGRFAFTAILDSFPRYFLVFEADLFKICLVDDHLAVACQAVVGSTSPGQFALPAGCRGIDLFGESVPGAGLQAGRAAAMAGIKTEGVGGFLR